jgi:uncharacterized lipoprotein YddW (UPF0748 family)
MKTGISLALVFFASATLLAAAGIYQPSSIIPPEPPREFRGAWIATVANKDWPSAPGLSVAQQKAELISLLNTAVNLKLNAVIFQVRPACDAMYASPIEPWSAYLTGVQGQPPEPFYDPLAFAIEEAHKRGLELHAWFNPFRVRFNGAQWYPAPNNISRTHPEWVREYNDQLWLDPGEPAARAYVLSVIMDVVRRYDVDGVQLDDYFYPYPAPLGKGLDIPFPDGASWREFGMPGGLSHENWRRQNINQFIQSVYNGIKSAKPWVKFGVSPFGIWRPGNPPQIRGFDSYANLFADSRLWLASGWVDYFSPQLYWPINAPQQSFPVLLNWWEQQNVRSRNLWPGLAAMDAGVKFPATEIANQIAATREQPGASGDVLFHLGSLENNAALADAVAGEYVRNALVPASPWLSSSPPARPALTEQPTGRNAYVFQWAPVGNTPVSKWVLQYYDTDYSWKTYFLPASQRAQALTFTPQAFSIRAVDRVGNLSQAAVVSKPVPVINRPAAVASPPPPAKSFWSSYKSDGR